MVRPEGKICEYVCPWRLSYSEWFTRVKAQGNLARAEAEKYSPKVEMLLTPCDKQQAVTHWEWSHSSDTGFSRKAPPPKKC